MNLTLNSAIGSSGLSGAVLDVASLSLPPVLVAGALNNLMTKAVADVANDAASTLCVECGMPRFIDASIHRVAAKAVVLFIKPSTIEVDAQVDRHTSIAIKGLTLELSASLVRATLKHLQIPRVEANGRALVASKHAGSRWREAIASSLVDVMNQQTGLLEQFGRQVSDTLNAGDGDFGRRQIGGGPAHEAESETQILQELGLAAQAAAKNIAEGLLATG